MAAISGTGTPPIPDDPITAVPPTPWDSWLTLPPAASIGTWWVKIKWGSLTALGELVWMALTN